MNVNKSKVKSGIRNAKAELLNVSLNGKVIILMVRIRQIVIQKVKDFKYMEGLVSTVGRNEADVGQRVIRV